MKIVNIAKKIVPAPVKRSIKSLVNYSGLKEKVLDSYVRQAPNDQVALDIFTGLWSSRLPGPKADLKAGHVNLFQDDRMQWAIKEMGGVRGKKVLELGPLEGGHSYQLEKAGAKSIVSVEANSRAYLKCLIVKELMQMKKVRFLLGDFVEYLKANPKETFDVIVAHGVLYHMVDPVELIWMLSQATDKLTIWTHYYDADILGERESQPHAFKGYPHTVYKNYYSKALNWRGFCGGPNPFSHWLKKTDILGALKFFGFKDIKIAFDEPHSQNGPSLALVAIKET